MGVADLQFLYCIVSLSTSSDNSDIRVGLSGLSSVFHFQPAEACRRANSRSSRHSSDDAHTLCKCDRSATCELNRLWFAGRIDIRKCRRTVGQMDGILLIVGCSPKASSYFLDSENIRSLARGEGAANEKVFFCKDSTRQAFEIDAAPCLYSMELTAQRASP